MSEENEKTLAAYEAHFLDYIQKTPDAVSGGLQIWLDTVLSGLPKTARIFEIGSGDGRDADYIERGGYAVECSDATQSFVTRLLERGFAAQQLNVITDPLMGSYDLILANGVLVHMTRAEVALVIRKVLTALKTRGRFAFSLKAGKGEEWVSDKTALPRFFCYWSQEQITAILKEAGYRSWEFCEDSSGRGSAATWIQIIATK